MPGGSKGYKLDPVLRLREASRIESTRSLRDAISALSAREQGLARAEAEVARLEAALAGARDRRIERARAGARAGDVQAGVARETAIRMEIAAATTRRDEALLALDQARLAVESAREVLARASADARAIERHRESWLERRGREIEKRKEEDP